jgi:hypothetical protein
LKKLQNGERSDKEVQLGFCEEIDNTLYYKNRIWVLYTMQIEILDSVHKTPLIEYPGIARILFFL